MREIQTCGFWSGRRLGRERNNGTNFYRKNNDWEVICQGHTCTQTNHVSIMKCTDATTPGIHGRTCLSAEGGCYECIKVRRSKILHRIICITCLLSRPHNYVHLQMRTTQTFNTGGSIYGNGMHTSSFHQGSARWNIRASPDCVQTDATIFPSFLHLMSCHKVWMKAGTAKRLKFIQVRDVCKKLSFMDEQYETMQ